jgi:hypothetical protein
MPKGEQRSNREKKKPKKDKSVAPAAGATTLTGVLRQRDAQKTSKLGKKP